MERRTLLTALGTAGVSGLTGCLSHNESLFSDSTTPETANSTSRSSLTTTEGEIQRAISLASRDSIPDKYKIRIKVDILESLITTEHTAKIQITITNMGSRRALSIWGSMCDLFNRNRGGSDSPPGLWLHKPEQAASIDRKESKWVADKNDDVPRGYPLYGCGRKMINTGESLSSKYVVWDDYQVPGYLTPGTYRWEETVSITENTDTQDSDNQQQSFTWGFSLLVEDPAS